MSTQAIVNVQKMSAENVVDLTPDGAEVFSLDDRLRDTFATASATTEADYRDIMAKSNNPQFLADPGGLFELQKQLGEYKQRVETISALTRKGVDVVTTLLRA